MSGTESEFKIRIDGPLDAKGSGWEARCEMTSTGLEWRLQGNLAKAVAKMMETSELVEAATDLAELLNDYMTVSSITANDRYRAALERVNALLGLGADEYDDGRDVHPNPNRK